MCAWLGNAFKSFLVSSCFWWSGCGGAVCARTFSGRKVEIERAEVETDEGACRWLWSRRFFSDQLSVVDVT
jgi:hypothetical protein